MKLMFINYIYKDAGSIMDIYSYSKAADKLGHKILIYGKPQKDIPLNFSLNTKDVDYLIFILEWTTFTNNRDRLDLTRLLNTIPRHKRIVIDCDGNYNEKVLIKKDYNHKTIKQSKDWIKIINSISDRIYQPSLKPKRNNVETFFFHAYDKNWEVPLDFHKKFFDMIYVGHNKFRWVPMEIVLNAIKPIRNSLKKIGIYGHGWDKQPEWSKKLNVEDNYLSKPKMLKKLDIEVLEPILFSKLINTMSLATFNPIIFRSVFMHFRLTTPRMYETFAANTIPLLSMGKKIAEIHFGKSAKYLVLPKKNPEKKLLDIITNPDKYKAIVQDIRNYLHKYHSHELRLKELINFLK